MRISYWSSDVCSSDLLMPPSESRPDAAIGIAGLTPPSESCGNRSRFPPVAVHARVIVCVLYRPATVVFRVSGEYPMSLSRFGIVGLVLAAGLGLSACASDEIGRAHV